MNPYKIVDGKSKCSFDRKTYLHKTGIYVIAKNFFVIYVGMSSVSLYKTAYRHFQKWSYRYGITYTTERNNYLLKFIPIELNKDELHDVEIKLIRGLFPRDNKLYYKEVIEEENEIDYSLVEGIISWEDYIKIHGHEPF